MNPDTLATLLQVSLGAIALVAGCLEAHFALRGMRKAIDKLEREANHTGSYYGDDDYDE